MAPPPCPASPCWSPSPPSSTPPPPPLPPPPPIRFAPFFFSSSQPCSRCRATRTGHTHQFWGMRGLRLYHVWRPGCAGWGAPLLISFGCTALPDFLFPIPKKQKKIDHFQPARCLEEWTNAPLNLT